LHLVRIIANCGILTGLESQGECSPGVEEDHISKKDTLGGKL